jgi:hypothetical protein
MMQSSCDYFSFLCQCHSTSVCYSKFFYRASTLVPKIISFFFKKNTSLCLPPARYATPPLFLFFKMMYITKHLCVFSTAFEVGKWRSITFKFLTTFFFNFTNPDVFHNYHKIYTFVQHIYKLVQSTYIACGYLVKGCRCVGRMYIFYDNYLLLLTYQQTK